MPNRDSAADDATRMKARLVAFGELEVDGRRYTRDVVIDGGRVRKRRKGPSKPHRAQYGHTPVSIDEDIPWGGTRLVIGTGAHGRLPVAPDVIAEAHRRGIEVVAVPTGEACRLLARDPPSAVHAILHVTC